MCVFLFCLFLCLVWSYFKVGGLGGGVVFFCLFLFLVWSYFKVVGLGGDWYVCFCSVCFCF